MTGGQGCAVHVQPPALSPRALICYVGHFCGINASARARFSSQCGTTEHGVGKRVTHLATGVPLPPVLGLTPSKEAFLSSHRPPPACPGRKCGSGPVLRGLGIAPSQNGTFQQGHGAFGLLWESWGGPCVKRNPGPPASPSPSGAFTSACCVLRPLILCHCCHLADVNVLPEPCGARYHLTSVQFFCSTKRGEKPQISSVTLAGFHPWGCL